VKLAISNIAWDRDEEAAAAETMSKLGVAQVEIAPTKAWDKPLEATDADIAAYRRWWDDRGVKIVALQSLNYGHPEFQIFQDVALRIQFLKYLQGIIVLGSKLGAKVMVFGSPKNRLVDDLPAEEANAIAIEFFSTLGQTAAEQGAIFCIEPNPTDYGCDFVTDSLSGIDLVKSVNHPGFGLHLDAAGLTLAGDNPVEIIPEAMPYLRHFHLSEPFLGEVGPGKVDHASINNSLTRTRYDRILSIEMKPGEAGTNLPRVRRAIEYVQGVYPITQ
jgi:D-psicose/D-tagatose/L-ribulose 3-epimerase